METMKKTLVYSRRPEIRRQRVAQCYVAAWMGGEGSLRGECMCVAESLCSSPGTVTTLFINWLSVQSLSRV